MMFSMSTVLHFLVGSCWLFVEAVKDITNDLAHFKGNEKADWNNPTMKLNFLSSIRFYLDAKQLSRQWGRKVKGQESEVEYFNNIIYLQTKGQIQRNLLCFHRCPFLLDTLR